MESFIFTELDTNPDALESFDIIVPLVDVDTTPTEVVATTSTSPSKLMKNIDTHVGLFCALAIVTFAVSLHILCHVISLCKQIRKS